MDNKEILEKAKNSSKIDEREKSLFQKANLISVMVMATFIVGFVIVMGALKIRPAYFALLASLFAYCATLFISRYALYEKKIGVAINAIAFTLAFVAMFTLFILSIVLGW